VYLGFLVFSVHVFCSCAHRRVKLGSISYGNCKCSFCFVVPAELPIYCAPPRTPWPYL